MREGEYSCLIILNLMLPLADKREFQRQAGMLKICMRIDSERGNGGSRCKTKGTKIAPLIEDGKIFQLPSKVRRF